VYFLLNDVVLSLELQTLSPPMEARRMSSLSMDDVQRLGRELFAEEPRLQHRAAERAKKLATLIISKAPEVNAALFVAPTRNCRPEEVAVRLASLDLMLMAQLHQDQQSGRLSPAVADQRVWAVATAA
jgi:hypothetical protein